MFQDKELIEKISDADLVLADISYPCGYTFVDKFNVPFRVEISPVGFYGVHFCSNQLPSIPRDLRKIGYGETSN